MAFALYDDRFDELEAIEDAWESNPGTIGLHVMATTVCCRKLSDGVLHPRWLRNKLPAGAPGKRLLEAMVAHDLFVLLRAGATLTVVDKDHNKIELGPFDEDRYLVREFLRFNWSSVMVREKRAADAERQRLARLDKRSKRRGVTADVRADVTPDVQPDTQRDSASASLVRAEAPPRSSHPIPSNELLPPSPPRGGRQREKDRFEQGLLAWTERHFPGGDHRAISYVIQLLRGAGVEPTPEAIRSRVAVSDHLDESMFTSTNAAQEAA